MTEAKSPILFAVLEYGEFPELLRVADLLHEKLDRPVVFLFVKRSYRRLTQDTQMLVDRGYAWTDADGRLHHEVASPSAELPPEPVERHEPRQQQQAMPLRRTRTGLGRKLLAGLAAPAYVMPYLLRDMRQAVRVRAREAVNCLRDIRRFRERLATMRAALKRLEPCLVVVGQDTPGTDLPFLLVAAGKLGIPRLITPFAMFALRETADYAKARTDHHVSHSALNALVARLFPHWVLKWDGTDVLRLPGSRALALEMLGLVQGLPWSPLTEPVEAITAESEVAADALAEQGLPRDRLKVVGSPVHDRLAAFLANRADMRSRLCNELGMDPSKPLLVCGWPVNLFPWLAGRPIHFPDYAAVATTWAQALAGVRDRHSINIVITVHPKTLPEEYKLALDLGLPCRVAGADELIAACDVFTTLNGSSITAWAIAAGIPVLLFDCFETRYTDFDDVPTCTKVNSEKMFLENLELHCKNDDARAPLRMSQRDKSSHWGVLDGLAGARLAAVAANILEERYGRPSVSCFQTRASLDAPQYPT